MRRWVPLRRPSTHDPAVNRPNLACSASAATAVAARQTVRVRGQWPARVPVQRLRCSTNSWLTITDAPHIFDTHVTRPNRYDLDVAELDLPQQWGLHFGLAVDPLFGVEGVAAPGAHTVLLDGGNGSFALSATDDALWRETPTAAWAWSSNLPHHVTVTADAVAVTRWDRPSPQIWSRKSVDGQLDSFYEYLTLDRIQTSQRVVDSVLGLFRQVRSLVANSGVDDAYSVDAFLAFLRLVIERDRGHDGHSLQTPIHVVGNMSPILGTLQTPGLETLVEQVLSGAASYKSLRLFPSLTVRHAGSEIFQEAHFELIRIPGLDMFGYAAPAVAKPTTRGGAHFTPAPLARALAEQVLEQLEDLHDRDRLVILDPACGSGAFLVEAIRTLRRQNFAGELELVGRDNSQAAISMARFAVGQAATDWSRDGPIRLDLSVTDSLNELLPAADAVLMNPPFISWPALSDVQREQMRTVLGPQLRGRADFSMAFVKRALDRVSPGGALGTLIPANVLSLEAAAPWRQYLLDQADLRLIASIGDYGLFAHALIQVAALVLAKPSASTRKSETALALAVADGAEATGNGLRALRRLGSGGVITDDNRSFWLFPAPAQSFRDRPTWWLTNPQADAALARLTEQGAARIDELFEVRQKILTGLNDVLLISDSDYLSLPAGERTYFRPAVVNDSIQDGQLRTSLWVFYPYNPAGLIIRSEDQLRSRLPTYSSRFLFPNRTALRSRAQLVRANTAEWWGLVFPRTSWAFDPQPKILSKYRGGRGAFVPVPAYSNGIIVQGFAWLPKWSDNPSPTDGVGDEDTAEFTTDDLVCAYAALMNSRPFQRVLSLFCPKVAGGQFDLSPKYVDPIPMPNLFILAQDPQGAAVVNQLATLGRTPRLTESDWTAYSDQLAVRLYGEEFFAQVL